LERVADRERCLLDPSHDGEELSGRLEAGGGRVPPARVDRLAVDEALDQISDRSAALRPDSCFFAQVGVGGLGRDAVDSIDRRACECEACCSGDSQARGFLGARVPVGKERHAVGVEEDLEADPLVDTACRQITQERKVIGAQPRALGECSGEDLRGRRRAGPEIVDQLGRGGLVLGDLLQDPVGHCLADLRVPAGERLTYAAHRPIVIAPSS
jgi:hypothetical protein